MSLPCATSGLCMFDTIPVQTDIQSSKYIDYHPISNIEGADTPIQFEVKGTSEDYIDCDSIFLALQVKITKADGSDIADADKAGLVNLPISTLFQDVSLMLNDKQIEGGNQTYPFSAYLATLSQFKNQAKKTHLEAWGWSADESKKFDDEGNSGFVTRQKWCKGSKTFSLFGPVFLDFFRQSRYLLSQVTMRLKFIRAKPEFALMAFKSGGVNLKISILNATLYVRRVVMNPSVINAHAKGLRHRNAVYPVSHTELTTFTIGAGSLSHTRDRLFPAGMPKALYITMVENSAYNGNYTKNPFNLQHFNLTKLALYGDGDYMVFKPFEPDFANKQYMREYCATMMSLKMFNTDDDNGLSYEDFGNGNFFLAYDLTPDGDIKAAHTSVTKSGNLRLELTFGSKLTDTINVLLYAIYDEKIEITELRDVLPSYQR